jgi:hypothetical protein
MGLTGTRTLLDTITATITPETMRTPGLLSLAMPIQRRP